MNAFSFSVYRFQVLFGFDRRAAVFAVFAVFAFAVFARSAKRLLERRDLRPRARDLVQSLHHLGASSLDVLSQFTRARARHVHRRTRVARCRVVQSSAPIQSPTSVSIGLMRGAGWRARVIRIRSCSRCLSPSGGAREGETRVNER